VIFYCSISTFFTAHARKLLWQFP